MSDNRTPEDLFLGNEAEDYNSPQYDSFLESIFSLGAIPSKTYDLFEDGNFKVKLRPLTPIENIEISKTAGAYGDIMSKEQVLRIEVLARAIVDFNGQALRFSDENLKEYRDFRGIQDSNYKPSEVEQQRHLVKYRFNNQLINLIYNKYEDLLNTQSKMFADLKKKS